jgi:hypothetical protein
MNEKSQFEAVHRDIFDIPPHPAADVFPMLDDDELEELAADIKANGLQLPLVVHELDGEPMLIDGRNRREACRRVGIVPDYILLDGQDPRAYIVSANIRRRNLTKGQQAMVVAKLYPEPEKGGRNKNAVITTEFSSGLLSHARTVLRHAPDLADHVINGSLSLDKAYEEARIRKGRADTHESRFESLKSVAPDLADLVVDGQLNLEEAEAAERERAERTRRNKKLLAEALHSLAAYAYLLEHEVQRKRVAEFVISEAELYQQHNPDPIDEVFHALEVFAEHAGPLLTQIIELKAEKENAENRSPRSAETHEA